MSRRRECVQCGGMLHDFGLVCGPCAVELMVGREARDVVLDPDYMTPGAEMRYEARVESMDPQ